MATMQEISDNMPPQARQAGYDLYEACRESRGYCSGRVHKAMESLYEAMGMAIIGAVGSWREHAELLIASIKAAALESETADVR